MKIFVFKNERLNAFGLPTYADSLEDLKIKIEDMYLDMKKNNKNEQIRKIKNENIYLCGEYNEKTGEIKGLPLEKVIDIKETFEKCENSLLEEQYKEYLKRKQIEEKYKGDIKE